MTCLLSRGAAADEAFSWGISDATVRFAGHDWFVKDSQSAPLQPGPCFWNPGNMRADASGLHLGVDRAPSGSWMSSEVMIDTSFGYGRYELEVQNALGSHDPNIIFGVFIWDETNGAQYNGEIDIIEASRFGDPYNPFNAQQVIAPWNMEGRINRFALPEDTPYAILAVDWTASDIVFQVSCPQTGYAASWSPADKRIIPKPTGFERLHLNAWQNFGAGPWYGAPVTFDVTSFEFSPSTGPKNVSAPLPAPSEGPFNVSALPLAPGPANGSVVVVNSSTTPANFLAPITAPPMLSPGISQPHPTRTPLPTLPARPPSSPMPSGSSPPATVVPSLTTLVGSAVGLSSGAFTLAGVLSAVLVLLW